MQSKLHHDLLVEAINDYLERGYRLLMLNRSLTKDYRPDAVVENEEEVVIIEAVVTSDRVQKVEDLQTLFSKPLRIDKRGGHKGSLNLRGGKGRFVNRPTRTGGKTYDKFFVYVPTEVARDGTFPFKVGDEVFMRVENDKLTVEKAAPK